MVRQTSVVWRPTRPESKREDSPRRSGGPAANGRVGFARPFTGRRSQPGHRGLLCPLVYLTLAQVLRAVDMQDILNLRTLGSTRMIARFVEHGNREKVGVTFCDELGLNACSFERFDSQGLEVYPDCKTIDSVVQSASISIGARYAPS
jgi:hypothetical protein